MEENKKIFENNRNKILIISAIAAGVIILGVIIFFLIKGLPTFKSSEVGGDGGTSDISSEALETDNTSVSTDGSQNTQNASSQNQGAQSTDTPTSSDTQSVDNPNASQSPTITTIKFVAPNICVVTGSCAKGTEKIVITGDKAQQTTVIPYAGASNDYFIAQVQCTGSGSIHAVAYQNGKDPSKQASRYVTYDNVTVNLMTKDEYRPVIGKNGFGHFYSALVGYSYSTQNLDPSFRTRAQKNIQDIVDAANNAGAKAIFLVIPSSAEIYPETLPDGYSKTTGESLYEAFYQIATSCGAEVIYPLDTMKNHKNDGVGYQLYQHTDSHWSTYGAYWGTYDLFNRIAKDFPSAKPRSLTEMGFYTREFYAGDSMFNLGLDSTKNNPTFKTNTTKMKELSTLYKINFFADTLRGAYHNLNVPSLYLSESNSKATVTQNPNGSGLPNAVIMRDSFSKVSFDMVSDRFNTVYWQTFDDYTVPTGDLAVADAHYLIYMYSERNLLKLMLNDKSATILNLR